MKTNHLKVKIVHLRVPEYRTEFYKVVKKDINTKSPLSI